MDRGLRTEVPRTLDGMDTETDPSIPVEAVEERQEPKTPAQATGGGQVEAGKMGTWKQLILEDGGSDEGFHRH